MDKRTLIRRAVASGMLVATLAQPLFGAVASATTLGSGSITQAEYDRQVIQYEKDLAEYQAKLAEQAKLDEQFAKDTETYKVAKAAYDVAKTAYDQRKATHDQSTQAYNTDKAKYDQDKAAYDTAKAQYDKDKTAYDAAKAAYDRDKTNSDQAQRDYQAALTRYHTAKAAYDTAKAKYDQDKAAYDTQKSAHDQKVAQYNTAKAEYDRKLAEFQTAEQTYNAARTKYQSDLAAYQAALTTYNAEKTASEQAHRDYQGALGLYTREKAVYDTAKAQYDRDLATWQQQNQANQAAVQEYQRKLAEYQTAMTQFNRDTQTYDQAVANRNNIIAANASAQAQYERNKAAQMASNKRAVLNEAASVKNVVNALHPYIAKQARNNIASVTSTGGVNIDLGDAALAPNADFDAVARAFHPTTWTIANQPTAENITNSTGYLKTLYEHGSYLEDGASTMSHTDTPVYVFGVTKGDTLAVTFNLRQPVTIGNKKVTKIVREINLKETASRADKVAFGLSSNTAVSPSLIETSPADTNIANTYHTLYKQSTDTTYTEKVRYYDGNTEYDMADLYTALYAERSGVTKDEIKNALQGGDLASYNNALSWYSPERRIDSTAALSLAPNTNGAPRGTEGQNANDLFPVNPAVMYYGYSYLGGAAATVSDDVPHRVGGIFYQDGDLTDILKEKLDAEDQTVTGYWRANAWTSQRGVFDLHMPELVTQPVPEEPTPPVRPVEPQPPAGIPEAPTPPREPVPPVAPPTFDKTEPVRPTEPKPPVRPVEPTPPGNAPVAPTPPNEPTAPTPPGDFTREAPVPPTPPVAPNAPTPPAPFTEQPPTPPIPPVRRVVNAVKPEVPKGPTSLTKSVSVDGGKTFLKADTPEAAAVAQKDEGWIWKLDVVLPNNVHLESFEIVDELVGQVVDRESIRVLDETGKDVTYGFLVNETDNTPGVASVDLDLDEEYASEINKKLAANPTAQAKLSILIPSIMIDDYDVNAPQNSEVAPSRLDDGHILVPNIAYASFSGTLPQEPATPETGTSPAREFFMEGSSNLSHVKYSDIIEDPVSTKTVSVDGGENFQDAGLLNKRSDDYIWKLDHVLPAQSTYTSITITDELEKVQEVDANAIKVFSYDGEDVTDQGKLTVDDKGQTIKVQWTAAQEFLDGTNTKFGPKSKDRPRVSMTIPTNVRKAKATDETKYLDAESGLVVIPNKGGLTVKAKGHKEVTTETNVARVTLPAVGPVKVAKFVAKDGDKPNWADRLALDTFDDLYQYRSEFQLPANHNFDAGDLVLSDTYESIQSYDKVLVTDASGADITKLFEIKTEKLSDSQIKITATPKDADDFDDKGETINLVIKGAKLTGATGQQQLAYLATKDSEGGYHSGIVIPNQSQLVIKSPIKGREHDLLTNKTWVSFDLTAKIDKMVESDERVDQPTVVAEAEGGKKVTHDVEIEDQE